MYNKISEWLDTVLENEFPDEVIAVAFNLYEDGDDSWSMEVVGTSSFDEDDPDWACDEVTDLGTREEPFAWEEESSWEEVQSEMSHILVKYLEEGKFADKLLGFKGLGVGFVDGDLVIIHSK